MCSCFVAATLAYLSTRDWCRQQGRRLRTARVRHALIDASIVVALLAVIGITLPSAIQAEDDPHLTEIIQPLISSHSGTVAVTVKHLKSGATYSHRADEPMPTASLIKFPIMVAAYQQATEGRLELTKSITLKDDDKVPGSGILTSHFSAGTTISVRDAIRLMIVYSDNTATNLVIDQIGLPSTTSLMTKWELPNTHLHSKVYRGDTSVDPGRSKVFGLGSTTAAEMLRLLERLQRKELVSAEASQQMYEHLLACDDKRRLSQYQPGGH